MENIDAHPIFLAAGFSALLFGLVGALAVVVDGASPWL